MNKRWRANDGESYYYIVRFDLVFSAVETFSAFDDSKYRSGNYFKTREQASEALRLIQETIIEYHQNKINKEMEANPIKE